MVKKCSSDYHKGLIDGYNQGIETVAVTFNVLVILGVGKRSVGISRDKEIAPTGAGLPAVFLFDRVNFKKATFFRRRNDYRTQTRGFLPSYLD